ncbi:hypothetical protein RHGRI_001394 [Rhododendron griersonianum]|uniref:Uncharacterized protein n=1 Tax=Rhododendron griersonianum TaxID=479676 RepID=A0AAV6LKY5_9ERIC|nr:hypothetical protein RHGRI_001394 [Rhododendron griersonianum]
MVASASDNVLWEFASSTGDLGLQKGFSQIVKRAQIGTMQFSALFRDLLVSVKLLWEANLVFVDDALVWQGNAMESLFVFGSFFFIIIALL